MLLPIPNNINKNIAIQSVIAPCISSSDIEKVKRDINVSDWKEMMSKKIEVKGKYQLFKNIELFPHLIKIVSNINSQAWRFDINYLNCEIDMPSVLEYEKGGQFGWHRDIEPEHSTRKLSFTIQLSDSDEYEGGDLEFFQSTNKESRKKGNIIVYPSFLWNRVTQITNGKRLTIDGWIHGPVYR